MSAARTTSDLLREPPSSRAGAEEAVGVAHGSAQRSRRGPRRTRSAGPPGCTGFGSIGERATRARTAKGRIAAAAAKLIPDDSTVFLDAGTTVCAVARAILRRKNLTHLIVVTDGLHRHHPRR